MNKFSFSNDNATSKRVEKFIDRISFSYHINTFEFPTEHGHADYWEFTLITDGKIYNVLNGEKIAVSAGQAFFATTDDVHSLKKAGGDKVRYVNVIAREPAVRRLAESFAPDFFERLRGMNRKYTFPVELTAQIEETIHQVLLLPDDACEEYNGLLCGAVMLVMQFLFRKSVDIVESEKISDRPAWVLILNKAMKKTDFLTYDVSALCKLLNYSRMQLSRLFREYFGTTPHKFLVGYKLRYAQNLLITTDMKVIDVAEFVGFSNLASFNSYFKNAYGTTPGRFRKGS